jgi:anti-sigma regulatory factor (Ser/Thr protein kinase)
MVQSLDLDPERVVAIQVAVGEAANNVIEHAYGLTPGEIRIRANRDAGSFIIDVQDSGQWRRPRVDRGGRGLTIMRGLADETHVDRGANGTTVRLVMRLAGSAQEARV